MNNLKLSQNQVFEYEKKAKNQENLPPIKQQESESIKAFSKLEERA